MKLYKLTIFILVIYLFASCVPYRKIVYVQGDVKQKKSDTTEYKIQKNDILYVKIKSTNEIISKVFYVDEEKSRNISLQTLFFNGYTVDNDGFIDLPVVKKIKVEGKTFEQVKKIIRDKLLSNQFKTINDIFIQVKLAGIVYTIVGEVKKPKTGVLYKTQPNVFDVLADAGDITLVGNRKELIVMREENGNLIKRKLDLTDPEIVNSPYFYVRPNDIFYVKPLKQKVLGTGETLQQTIRSTITALSLITTIILLSRYTK